MLSGASTLPRAGAARSFPATRASRVIRAGAIRAGAIRTSEGELRWKSPRFGYFPSTTTN